MRAACVLTAAAGVCGMVATEAFVFNPSVTSARPVSRRQQQRTRVVAAAAVADVGSGDVADTAVAADGSDDAGGREWEDCQWDGQSWPAKSNEFNTMPMEAKHWEVEDERVPVWEDDPNPDPDFWYSRFKPSDIEIEAAEMGFDWTDEWFEANGMTRTDLPAEEADKK